MSKEFAREFYSSGSWQDVRDSYAKEKFYICEVCGKPTGKNELIIHHKIHLNPENINNPSISLNKENLQALCRSCHAKAHLKDKKEYKPKKKKERTIMFDSDGNVVNIIDNKEGE